MAKDMRTSKTGATQASAADLYQFMKKVSMQHCRRCDMFSLHVRALVSLCHVLQLGRRVVHQICFVNPPDAVTGGETAQASAHALAMLYFTMHK